MKQWPTIFSHAIFKQHTSPNFSFNCRRLQNRSWSKRCSQLSSIRFAVAFDALYCKRCWLKVLGLSFVDWPCPKCDSWRDKSPIRMTMQSLATHMSQRGELIAFTPPTMKSLLEPPSFLWFLAKFFLPWSLQFPEKSLDKILLQLLRHFLEKA